MVPFQHNYIGPVVSRTQVLMVLMGRGYGLGLDTKSRETHRNVPATGKTGETRSIKMPTPLLTPPLYNLELSYLLLPTQY
jgi:hypothetical protein